MRRMKQGVSLATGFLIFVFLVLRSRSINGYLGDSSGAAVESESASSVRAQDPATTVTSAVQAADGVRQKSNATIGQITMIYGDVSDSYKKSLKLRQEYGEKHGYEMFVLERKTLKGMWSKVAYMLGVIEQELEKPPEERLKWLFWFDADIVIMNPKIALEVFLPPRDKYLDRVNMLVTADQNGLNTGALFVRVNEWALRFFADTIALPTYLPDLKLKYSDQSAMAHLINETEKYRDSVAYIPQRWINGYRGPRDKTEKLPKDKKIPANAFRKGEFQIHFAGKYSWQKAPMPKWLDFAEKHMEEMEVDVDKTSLEADVAQFWKERAKKLQSSAKAKEKAEQVKADEERARKGSLEQTKQEKTEVKRQENEGAKSKQADSKRAAAEGSVADTLATPKLEKRWKG